MSEATKILPGVDPERLKLLKEPFPVKWRVQAMYPLKSQQKTAAQCVAYIDARDVENRLDEVVGVENWQTETKVEKDNLYTKLSIMVNGAWISKTDVGSESKIEPEKGEVSDSLKRAAVQWGIGRFLYDLEIQKLPVNQYKGGKFYPATHDGKILWNGKELSDYLNKIVKLTSTGNASAIIAEYSKTVTGLMPLITEESVANDLWKNAKSLQKDETFVKALKAQLEQIRK